MNTLQALIMGLLQGLTEYLPVSSSGHLTIASELFGIDGESNMTFTIAVHVATVLSTLVILGSEIGKILKGMCNPLSPRSLKGNGTFLNRLNPDQRYVLNILVSMIPIGIVGVFFKDQVEDIFGSGLLVVGICLLLTAALLTFSYLARPRQRENISLGHAFIIGLAQAVAVLPGLSRSGSTIATGLLLGNKKEKLAQFSFLMVIPPILGEALLDVLKMVKGEEATGGIDTLPLIVGFVAAFISGCAACKWMIGIVKKGKLIYFAYYCAIVGVASIVYSLLK
ncbi:MAG: undecaprenyl-diphosphate phosphatase [Prevotellamassilia sp.]|jgi:undecaprenyl-diphosphatase|nr:undecaprenyl-diphosphate phosphatase [Prevotellamassilia sp.]